MTFYLLYYEIQLLHLLFYFQVNIVNVKPVMHPVKPVLAHKHWIVLPASKVFCDTLYVYCL